LNLISFLFLDQKRAFHNNWCCCEIVLWGNVESQLEIDIQDTNLHGESYGVGQEGPHDNFHQAFFVCDPTLGPEFLHQIHIHYDMNFNLEMLIEKLQILTLATVSNE
jgi:hypothetical protein